MLSTLLSLVLVSQNPFFDGPIVDPLEILIASRVTHRELPKPPPPPSPPKPKVIPPKETRKFLLNNHVVDLVVTPQGESGYRWVLEEQTAQVQAIYAMGVPVVTHYYTAPTATSCANGRCR
jgi:hypothetical protein